MCLGFGVWGVRLWRCKELWDFSKVWVGHLKPSWMEIFLTPTLVLRPDTWSAGRPGSLHIEVCNLPQDGINLDPCQPALYETYNFVGVTCSIEHASLRVPAQLDIYRYRPASWGMRPLTNKPASFTRLIMRILPSV